jgi:hypothetical protein
MLAGIDTEEQLALLGSNLKDLWVRFANGRRLKEDHLEISRNFSLSEAAFEDNE